VLTSRAGIASTLGSPGLLRGTEGSNLYYSLWFSFFFSVLLVARWKAAEKANDEAIRAQVDAHIEKNNIDTNTEISGDHLRRMDEESL
jgi:hypothetical protein